MTTRQLQLDIVQHQEDGWWVAHCVQFNILTSARDKDECWKMAQALCISHVCHACKTDPDFSELFKPASAELSRLMAMAKDEGSVTLLMERHDHNEMLTLHRRAMAA